MDMSEETVRGIFRNVKEKYIHTEKYMPVDSDRYTFEDLTEDDIIRLKRYPTSMISILTRLMRKVMELEIEIRYLKNRQNRVPWD